MKFSVIIPVYNCEKYIVRCVQSLLHQIGKNDEIIILDDGSTDLSYNKCLETFKSDYRVRIIKKENSGVSDTRNLGIEKAKGKYILFIDADDWVSDGYINSIYKIINNNPEIQLINFGFFSEVENNNEIVSVDEIKYIDRFYKTNNDIVKDIINLYESSMLYNIWNKVYVKKVIKENNLKFKDRYFGEDMLFNRDYLACVDNFYNSSKCFYHYIRERDDSVTTRFKKDIFEIRKNEFLEFNEYFKSLNLSENYYYEFSCRRFVERMMGCVENIFCSKYSFFEKYREIKKIINDKITIECLQNCKLKSKKMKILIIPIKLKSVILTMIIGKFLHIVKTKLPAIFNKLKNKR